MDIDLQDTKSSIHNQFKSPQKNKRIEQISVTPKPAAAQQKQDSASGVVFCKVPVKKNLPLTADNPVLMDYMSRLIGTTKNLIRKNTSNGSIRKLEHPLTVKSSLSQFNKQSASRFSVDHS